jgi:outer membrane protein
MTSDVIDYYYGVSSKEARPDRPAYSPGSALNIEAELFVRYPLSQHFELVGIVGYTLLDSAISDSPIVDADYEMSATFGVLYTF